MSNGASLASIVVKSSILRSRKLIELHYDLGCLELLSRPSPEHDI